MRQIENLLSITRTILNDDFNSTPNKFSIGCYPVESILHSSLECLYNETCLNFIVSSINETVQHMVDRLFINRWYVDQSCDNYYKKCRPSHCVYSYIDNVNVLHIVTTTMGLCRGLLVLLGILTSFPMNAVFWILDRRQACVITFPTARK
jgi:hypothetical protein